MYCAGACLVGLGAGRSLQRLAWMSGSRYITCSTGLRKPEHNPFGVPKPNQPTWSPTHVEPRDVLCQGVFGRFGRACGRAVSSEACLDEQRTIHHLLHGGYGSLNITPFGVPMLNQPTWSPGPTHVEPRMYCAGACLLEGLVAGRSLLRLAWMSRCTIHHLLHGSLGLNWARKQPRRLICTWSPGCIVPGRTLLRLARTSRCTIHHLLHGARGA